MSKEGRMLKTIMIIWIIMIILFLIWGLLIVRLLEDQSYLILDRSGSEKFLIEKKGEG